MSLVSTSTLAALWRAANSSDGGEPEAASFWQHLLSKHIFTEEYWVCDAEIRPEPGSRRRVDRGVRYVGNNGDLVVLLWLEAKGDVTPAKLKEAEEQALDACKRNLNSHKRQAHIYALTTGKTKAKAWIYERDDPALIPLFGDKYVEVNSTEGRQMSKWFERMKTLVPAAVANNPTATRVVDPTPTYSNPIFSRHDSIPTTTPAIKSKYTQVQHAKRDSGSQKALIINGRRIEGWQASGEGVSRIMYCEREKLWMYIEDAPKS